MNAQMRGCEEVTAKQPHCEASAAQNLYTLRPVHTSTKLLHFYQDTP
jgi:hypothetical protein